MWGSCWNITLSSTIKLSHSLHQNFPLLENGANGNYLHVVCGPYVPGTMSIEIIHYLETDTAKGFSEGGGEKQKTLERSLLLNSQF